MVHPELHAGVDVLLRGDALLQREGRLVDDLADQAADHAADAVLDVHDRAPETFEELPREVGAAHELDRAAGWQREEAAAAATAERLGVEQAHDGQVAVVAAVAVDGEPDWGVRPLCPEGGR